MHARSGEALARARSRGPIPLDIRVGSWANSSVLPCVIARYHWFSASRGETHGHACKRARLCSCNDFHSGVDSGSARDLHAGVQCQIQSGPGRRHDQGHAASAQNLCSDPANNIDEMESKVYADLQVAWSPTLWDQAVQFALGINNVLDEDPPPCRACV